MKQNTIIEAAAVQSEQVEPAGLVTLAELVAEGFGEGPYVRTSRDAIDTLARQLDGEVIIDDIGRRCVARSTARRLFTERADAEQRQRETRERHDAEMSELAAKNRPWGGIPDGLIPDGVSPAAAMLQAAKDAEPRRRSVLEEALDNDGSLTYHPVRDES
jgi:hypothetical protein